MDNIDKFLTKVEYLIDSLFYSRNIVIDITVRIIIAVILIVYSFVLYLCGITLFDITKK